MTSHGSKAHSSEALVHKLVCHILKKPADAVNFQYRNAVHSLNISFPKNDCDEFAICEKIKNKFRSQGRAKDASTFCELLRKLQTSSVLKFRVSVLNFLFYLYDFDNDPRSIGQFVNSFSKLASLDSDLALNSHDVINKQINKSLSSNVDLGDFFIKGQPQLSKCLNKSNSSKDRVESVSRVQAMFSAENQLTPVSNGRYEHMPEKTLSTRSHESNLGSVCYSQPNLKNLLRDILFAMQGLQGDILQWETNNKKFDVKFMEQFPDPVKSLSLRFVELGWMYCRINKYCIAQSKEKSAGLIVQSFVAALKLTLMDYYKLIAELEALLTQESILEPPLSSSNSLTLHRMSVWIWEPHTQLKFLASVVDACAGKKGGALASVLYSHLQHGDPFVRTMIQNLLRDVTRPFFKMLSNWIYCGELDDVFGEFLVETKVGVLDSNLWQDKYKLNKPMVPSFITIDQANKILSTGKAINFLHQVCQDNTVARDEDRRIKALELMSTESLFSQEKDANFENILEKNYIKTSKTVLQVLYDKYNLMDHLLAMRNYFLLGQGDFIRHLMDLLDTDLAKPGKSLFIHNLTGILESAIRATNAQFHNPEVLQRLDVRVLDVSLNETGWDVFCLDYRVDGPIGTVFTPDCMKAYFRLFTALWKAKRMEYILSKISHSRTYYIKLQAKVPEVVPVLSLCHAILAQMVHFVQQTQYYMAFEVMECCWADLLLKLSSAPDLDEVIKAHQKFLDTLLTRALLNEKSKLIRSHLTSIYGMIIQFDEHQNEFWSEVRYALDKENELNELIQANTNNAGWGLSDEQKREYLEPLHKLKTHSIGFTKGRLKVLSNFFEDIVQKFLIMLNDQDDPNLRFLSFRLDFNEHYKSRNSRLQTSLTYQHRRKSIK